MPPDLPGLAVHIGAGTGRDTLELTSRLAAAAGITRQRQLPGPDASLPPAGRSRPARPAPADTILARPVRP